MAAVFAVFVIVLFGFIYWQTDDYLVARSDKMIARQLDFIAALPGGRRIDAIDQHLNEDFRGVQYAALFGADGRRLAGNLDRFPPDLKMNDTVQSVPIVREIPSGQARHVIRAIGRRMSDGDALVIGARSTRRARSPTSSARRWRSACCPPFCFACWRARG